MKENNTIKILPFWSSTRVPLTAFLCTWCRRHHPGSDRRGHRLQPNHRSGPRKHRPPCHLPAHRNYRAIYRQGKRRFVLDKSSSSNSELNKLIKWKEPRTCPSSWSLIIIIIIVVIMINITSSIEAIQHLQHKRYTTTTNMMMIIIIYDISIVSMDSPPRLCRLVLKSKLQSVRAMPNLMFWPTHLAYAFSASDGQNSSGSLDRAKIILPLRVGSRSSMTTFTHRPNRQNRTRNIPV